MVSALFTSVRYSSRHRKYLDEYRKHRLKANDKRPEIEVIKDFGNIPMVECYPGQLNQVFMNLISNAIDALDEYRQSSDKSDNYNNFNTIKISTKLNLTNYVNIFIKDNGMGMSREVKERVFEQFFTTKSVGKGTGLGLSISRQIVEDKHQGKLSCISALGEGTEFVIEIPIK